VSFLITFPSEHISTFYEIIFNPSSKPSLIFVSLLHAI